MRSLSQRDLYKGPRTIFQKAPQNILLEEMWIWPLNKQHEIKKSNTELPFLFQSLRGIVKKVVKGMGYGILLQHWLWQPRKALPSLHASVSLCIKRILNSPLKKFTGLTELKGQQNNVATFSHLIKQKHSTGFYHFIILKLFCSFYWKLLILLWISSKKRNLLELLFTK